MSRSNRVLFAALVGLAVLYPIERTGYAQTSAEHADQKPKDDAKPIDLSPIANEIKGLTRAIESIKSEGKSADEIQRENDDLRAQQEMAKWARLMYIVTAWTTFLTAVGIALIGATLYYTKMTLREAEKTTKAAEDTIAVTRDMARDQSRAYVQAESAEIRWGIAKDPRPWIRITVSNKGQTPAHWFGYKCLAVSDEETAKIEFDRQSFHSKSVTRWSALGIGQELTFDVQDSDVKEQILSACALKIRLRVDGVIVYRTFFGELFETEFSFYVHKVYGQKTAAGLPPIILKEEPQKMMRTTQPVRTYHKIGESRD